MKVKRLYKIYRDDTFMGTIKTALIINDFEYSQDINTSGAQLQIEVATTLEQAGLELDTSTLINQTGAHIITDSGAQILLDKQYSFANVPMDLNNRLKVIKFHDAAPNGETEFDGLITSWKAGYKKNSMMLTAMSWGVKLDQYLIEAAAGTPVVQHLVNTGEITQYTFDYNGTLVNDAFFGQTFQVLSETTVSSLKLLMRLDAASIAPQPYIFELNQKVLGAPGPNLVYVNRSISNTVQDWVEFVFPTPVTLQPGIEYNFETFLNTSGTTNGPVYLAHDSGGTYANGSLYIQNPNGSSNFINQSKDLVFQLITSSGGGNIGGNFLSKDPAAIVRELLDNFERRGGLVTYTDDSVQSSGTLASYNFKFDTIFDGLKKCVELAPSNYYWYVDPGTNILQFKRQTKVADHIFKLGKHIEDLELEYTLDDVKNVVYTSGGDTGGGENLLTVDSDVPSQGKYGVWLDHPSDSRVTLAETAHLLAQSTINQNRNPVFRTTVKIPRTVYNIDTIRPGQMVGFGDFRVDFINKLLLQIVGFDYTSQIVTLYLQTLPPVLSHRVEDIKRNLNAVQTVNNPSIAT